MLVEEYRLHAELFGRRRFLAFPAFVAALVAGGVSLLSLADTDLGVVVGGLFVLVLFFGLQVGTIGLVGRDAMRDVLGDVTLLVFSARTLPVSRRRLLVVFLVKDLLYYVAFFLTPVALGFLPLAVGSGFTTGGVVLLWGTLAGTFALGTGASLVLAGIGTRTRAGLVAVGAAVAAGVLVAPDTALALTPYATYTEPSVATAVRGFVPVIVLVAAGPVAFEPPTRSGARRVTADRYLTLRRVGDGVTARTLLEVARSSGSVWKVGFSLGVLFAVTGLLLDRLAAATALDPSAGIAFGTLLGLGTFTTYNWVTQADEPREYLRYPVALQSVVVGKRRAFLVLAVPTGVAYLALAAVLFPGFELLLGVVVFPLVATYVFGVTAYTTWLSPSELLFDTVLFGAYGLALSLVSVPLLVAALAFGTAPVLAGGAAVAFAAAAAVIGVGLARRVGPRWNRRLQGMD